MELVQVSGRAGAGAARTQRAAAEPAVGSDTVVAAHVGLSPEHVRRRAAAAGPAPCAGDRHMDRRPLATDPNRAVPQRAVQIGHIATGLPQRPVGGHDGALENRNQRAELDTSHGHEYR